MLEQIRQIKPAEEVSVTYVNGHKAGSTVTKKEAVWDYRAGRSDWKEPKVKGSYSRFKHAQRNGEIYLQPCKRGKIEIDPIEWAHHYTITSRDGNGVKQHEWVYTNYQLHGPNYDMSSVMDTAIADATKAMDWTRNEILTQAYAKANARTYDLLTEIGELPETLELLTGAYKALRHPIRTLKSLELASRNFRWNHDVVKYVTKAGKKRTRRVYFKEYYWHSSWHRWADLVSQAWLVWRYGIMPLVYSINDVLTVLQNRQSAKDKTFETTKIRHVHNWSDNRVIGTVRGNHAAAACDIRASIDVRIVDRVVIKTRYSIQQLLDKQLALNPVASGWELTKLSFVVDWFIQVGDLISALTPTCYEVRGITYSRQVNCLVNALPGPIPDVNINGDYTTKVDKFSYRHNARSSTYTREVVADNVYNFLTLPTGLQLTMKRQLDAFALSYSFLRGTLVGLDRNFLKKKGH